MPVNGSAEIVAQVIEPSGTPPQHGTHVTFTTTLGTIQPAEAETDISGRVLARFVAGTSNGTATITANSGGASTGTTGAIKIAVGTAAVGRVTVNAWPASVPNTGGATTITASVFDINGNALSSAPVSFSTTAGILSMSLAIADAAGVASHDVHDQSAGHRDRERRCAGACHPRHRRNRRRRHHHAAGNGTVVRVGQRDNLGRHPRWSSPRHRPPPSAGLPASFTFAVTVAATNGSAVRDVAVNWGDGSRMQSLGAISGNAVVSHVYNKAGTYLVTGTVTDAAGNSNTVSTSVTVIPVPRPTILITPSPSPVKAGGTITFTIQVTAPGRHRR